MLCSVCKKNMAVIFINKLDKDGNKTNETTGLCVECAKKQGINPMQMVMNEMENISPEEIENMSKQLESMLGGLGLDTDSMDDEENDEDSTPKKGLFGFSNLFGGQNIKDTSDDNEDKKSSKKKSKKTKYLDTYGDNLTNKARENKLDKVIGRKRELDRMIQILNRRSKNNPALIGEPGVGKTAIVNALAQEIVSGNVPSKLIGKEVYLIDMTSLVAGTQFRGQFESRVKGIIDECKSLGNIILAIDEVHNIVGGLEHDNSMNAANMLKPALANGSVQLIGATTLKEYRQYIEKDSALERRFQPVMVDEPTSKECFEILKGIKSYYEDYHKVVIPDEILKLAVTLSKKYIHDRFLPDKAIDLIDEACARVNLENVALSKLEKLQTKLNTLIAEEEEIESSLGENKDNDNNSTDIGSYEKAAKLKEEKCKLQTKIDELKEKIKPEEVTYDNLAQVIELWTKIPVARVKTSETEKLLSLKDNLAKRIIGQNEAIEAVSNAILRKRANIRNIERPPSFIFVGPTGVGKTEIVKQLAYELFDSKDAIIKLDMSEYMESNSTSKLIGSPPGYVGYDEAGQLTEKIRRNPYSIVLFDEIEKAHPSVYNILLQILDEGKLTDSQGRSVSFKHTIIVMTSNLGTNFKNDGYGFSNSKIEKDLLITKTNNALKEFFSPEFLNRVDEIITFNELSKDDLIKISKILLDELKEETSERNILFEYSDKIPEFITDKGYNKKFGARPLRRAIQKYIEDVISIGVIKGQIKENTKYLIDIEQEQVVIK